MGVDVFGRGTYGGGGMACAAAAQVALRAGTSLALFAPGWVLYLQHFISSKLKIRSDFF